MLTLIQLLPLGTNPAQTSREASLPQHAVKPRPGSGPEDSAPEDPSWDISPFLATFWSPATRRKPQTSLLLLAIGLNDPTKEELDLQQQQLRAEARKGFGGVLGASPSAVFCTSLECLAELPAAPQVLPIPLAESWRWWVLWRKRKGSAFVESLSLPLASVSHGRSSLQGPV